MEKRNNSDYERGKRWGWWIFRKNLQTYGSRDGVKISDSAFTTSQRYQRDSRLKKIKDGRTLTASLREMYRGIADGLFEAHERFERKKSPDGLLSGVKGDIYGI